MLIKQTVWLFVKALVITGIVGVCLSYVADESAYQTKITQICTNLVCW